MVAQTIKKFKKIDILVNNAGGVDVKGGDTTTATEADWDKILDVNLKGAFLCCMAVVPYMKKQKYGKIINISSMGAVNPAVSVLHYHAAKAGVLGLTHKSGFRAGAAKYICQRHRPGTDRDAVLGLSTAAGTGERRIFYSPCNKEVPLGQDG